MLSFVSMVGMAQVDVNAFTAGANEGITYFLPDTKLDIEVQARCISRVPGEFGRYADRFLRINDAVGREDKEWSIVHIDVKPVGVPNRQKAFTVALGNSVSSNITLNDDGIINAINRDVPTEKSVVRQKNVVKRVDARVYLTEEILQATSTAKMAELVAKEIYSIRESKIAITRGTADNMPKDGVSMQLVLDELDLQERTLTELFTGRVDTLDYVYNILLNPSAMTDTTKAVLFRFSRKLGLLEGDNLAGAPVYYDYNPLVMQDESVQESGKKKKKDKKKEGVCYIVPGRALVKIYSSGDTMYEDEIPVAQLGTVEVLSKSMFGKNSDTKVLFDTSTGGVISIDK